MADLEVTRSVHPVDEVPPLRRLAPLGLQQVLAMYAGAVAVPLIVGGAMISAGRTSPDDLAHLVVADLFIAGSRPSCSQWVSGGSVSGCP